MLAARLRRQGIHALLIDKNKRLGDSWRNRYHSLVLHDVIWANYFPYLKYPDDWPVFIPKDKIAGWFESYAAIMELNVVSRDPTFEGTKRGSTDPTTILVAGIHRGSWQYRIRRQDWVMENLHTTRGRNDSGPHMFPYRTSYRPCVRSLYLPSYLLIG